MRFYRLGGALLAAALVVGFQAMSVQAADDPKPAEAAPSGQPKATDLIFERKHLANVPTGETVTYNFERAPTDPKVLGIGFKDTITMKVVAEKEGGQKDVDLQIYTGDRARDVQKLEKFSINPVFAVYFAQGVSTFNKLAGGQVNYLQKSFSDGWLKAKVEPIKVDYKGKPIDAFRISMTPYVGDKFESKMEGWEGAKYVVTVSEQVPGEIVDLLAYYPNRYPPAQLKLIERTTLDGITGLEPVQ
jgi:hypothetical protein